MSGSSSHEGFHAADYDKEPLEIWEDPSFSVYCPWQAQVLGTFPSRDSAELFMKAVYERAKDR